VEAGIDLDFPEVWRAVGPLDRIVQAAGRCNREGNAERGRVVVFEPAEGRSPKGPYKTGLLLSRKILTEKGTEMMHNPDLYALYFKELFSMEGLDKNKVQLFRDSLNYPEIAKRYRLIDSDTVPVVVDYEIGLQRLDSWKSFNNRTNWQKLQPYLVNLFTYETEKFKRDGWLKQVSEGLFQWCGSYDEVRGLAESEYDPSDLIG